MKNICIWLLFFCSYANAWELQYKTKCAGWRLLANDFNLCFPERYYVKRVSRNAISFGSSVSYESVTLKFISTGKITQENEQLFKLLDVKSIHDRKVYLYKSTNEDIFSVRFGKFLIEDKEHIEVVIGSGGDEVALEAQIGEILSALTPI